MILNTGCSLIILFYLLIYYFFVLLGEKDNVDYGLYIFVCIVVCSLIFYITELNIERFNYKDLNDKITTDVL